MHELYSLNRRDKKRREYWCQLVATFEKSGMNLNVFAEQQYPSGEPRLAKIS